MTKILDRDQFQAAYTEWREAYDTFMARDDDDKEAERRYLDAYRRLRDARAADPADVLRHARWACSPEEVETFEWEDRGHIFQRALDALEEALAGRAAV